MGLLKSLTEVLEAIHEGEAALDRMQPKVEKLMATAQQFRDELSKIDQETNRIKAAWLELLARLEAGNLSEAEEAEVFEELKAQAEKLTGIGHNIPA